jgi:hypothetical protein
MSHGITSDMIIILLGLVTWFSFWIDKPNDTNRS